MYAGQMSAQEWAAWNRNRRAEWDNQQQVKSRADLSITACSQREGMEWAKDHDYMADQMAPALEPAKLPRWYNRVWDAIMGGRR